MSPHVSVVLDQSCASLAEPVSRFARTVVFTRNGGFLISPTAAAIQLREVIRQANNPGPHIIVGASFAAFTELIFASRWPELVDGLILVDPSHRLQGVTALKRLARDDVPSTDAVDQLRAMLRGFGPSWDEACAEVATVKDLGDIPLHVLEAGALEIPAELSLAVTADLLADRHALLLKYEAMSTRGRLTVVENAGHNITLQQPDAVLAAVREMVGRCAR